MRQVLILFVFIYSIGISSLSAQIDSQWRGDARDGKYHGEKLLKSWPSGGPDLITTLEDLGFGYSSPAVTKDKIYITGMEDGTGYLSAFDLSGKRLWKKAFGDEWEDDFPGSRNTPTVVGGKVYFASSVGTVYCYDSKGSKIWSLDMKSKFNAQEITWGLVESLLVDGDYVFCTPGSEDVSVAVLDRHTGKVLKKIKGNGQASGYCSPAIINHNGRRILVTMLAESLIGIDMKSLEMIFEHKHVTEYDINPNTPLYYDGYIYIVSGYDTGGQVLKLSDDGSDVSLVWSDSQLDSQIGAAVILDGHIYGSGHENRNWYCLDFLTGEKKYSSRELGRKGNIIYADGMLYIYSERGQVGLVKPDTSKFDVISSFRIKNGSGEHWAHPVIRDGRLYVRHGEILNIYNIAG